MMNRLWTWITGGLAAGQAAPKTAKRIEAFDVFPEGFSDRLLAPGWALHRHDMWEVAAFIAEQQPHYPDETLFALFEDVHQAFYTSGHARTHTSMDVEVEPNDPRVHPDSIRERGGEAWVHLRHPSEFPLQLAGFRDYLRDAQTEHDWHGVITYRLTWEGVPMILPGSLKTGEAWFDEEVAVSPTAFVLRVPVSHPPDAIAVFPNGYFMDDLRPAQNHALASALHDAVGLRLFGIGGSFVGYRRDTPLTAADAARFAHTIRPLYDDEDATLEGRIAAAVEGETVIFVAYGNR